jgi:hypothetical protein
MHGGKKRMKDKWTFKSILLSFWNWAIQTVKKIIKGMVDWTWTKAVLYWVVLSAGTMSELAFLVASLWTTLNASIHDFILIFIPEQMTQHLSDLAKAAFVGLPEIILALAIATTIGHVRKWRYNWEDGWAAAWSILYGLPTITFLGLSLWTIGCSVLKVGYTLPDWMVVCRALAGYTYGITALLYWIIGKPQEVDTLKEKDSFIAQLRQEMATKLAELQEQKDKIITQLRQEMATKLAQLQQEKDDLVFQFQQENTSSLASLSSGKDAIIAQLRQENHSFRVQLDSNKREMDRLNELLAEGKLEKQQLISTINRGSEEALQAYSDECSAWLKSGVKSAKVDEIVHYTGHAKRKIDAAIAKGQLQTAPRSKEERVLMSSLITWLKITPAPTLEPRTEPALHVVTG